VGCRAPDFANLGDLRRHVAPQISKIRVRPRKSGGQKPHCGRKDSPHRTAIPHRKRGFTMWSLLPAGGRRSREMEVPRRRRDRRAERSLDLCRTCRICVRGGERRGVARRRQRALAPRSAAAATTGEPEPVAGRAARTWPSPDMAQPGHGPARTWPSPSPAQTQPEHSAAQTRPRPDMAQPQPRRSPARTRPSPDMAPPRHGPARTWPSPDMAQPRRGPAQPVVATGGGAAPAATLIDDCEDAVTAARRARVGRGEPSRQSG
jgi:hypothetical protein